MRAILAICFLTCGCALAPVLKGEYDRNLSEIQVEFKETRGKIADTADVVYKTVVNPKEIAEALAQNHAEDMASWASEDVEFTKPTAAMDIMNIILGVLGLGSLGGFGAIRKIASLKETVKVVAQLEPEKAKEEALKRGVKV